MKDDYNFNLLKTILNLTIDKKVVWKKRLQLQTQFIHLLEEAFGTEISNKSFGFYPGKIYFSTPLTADPEYTKKMKPFWVKIKKILEKEGYFVYAPFMLTDPHSKLPDNLNSYQIRDLDHIQVLTAEVALFDLNRPSHGVGQEIEMSAFMPSIAFSQSRVTRMTKGMPGMLLVNYNDEKELMRLIKEIFKRKSYKAEPFFLDSCPNHPTKSVFKGLLCLNCQLTHYLHQI